MAKYIDADYILKVLAGFNDRENGNPHFFNGIDTAKEIVENAPTADVVEVKHGEWAPIVKQDNYLDPPYCDIIKCSECEEEADVSFHDAKYCYNCGAKMDGKKNDFKE